MRRGARNAQAGFSLIELIVAFVIVAIVLTLLFDLFAEGIGNLTQGGERAQAAIMAESKLAELDALGDLEPGELRGMSVDGWVWRIAVAAHADAGGSGAPTAADGPSLLSVTIEVSRAADPQALFALRTLRLGRGS